MMKRLAVLVSLTLLVTVVATDAFGRVGGGRSSGFRSYKSTPSTPPAQRSTQESVTRQPQQQPQSQPVQRPSFFNSGIFKTLVGGLLIGGLFSMLMGHGFQFGAPGLIEILLIAGVLFFIFRKVLQRKQAAQYQYATGSAPFSDEAPSPAEPKTSADVSINESFIKDIARSTFKTLQDAWSKGDMSSVRNLVTERMYSFLNDQLEELKRQGLKNIVEITYFQGVDIVEVGEEAGQKVVVVQIDALMRDYTVDGNNTIVQGSNDTPVDVREYWAFVGKGLDWKLDDIRQV